MAEAVSQQNNQLELLMSERTNTGSSRTNNGLVESQGYIVEKNFWDPEELYHPVPRERGQIFYFGSIDRFQNNPEDPQVPGAYSRGNHPQYKQIFNGIRKKLQTVLDAKLYGSFYYDRFYFEGQKLNKYIDQDSAEIIVRMNISNNLEEPWPVHLKTPDTYTDKQKSAILVPGEEKKIDLEPGDALIYKGCERPVWRDVIPQNKNNRKLFGKKKEYYYHEIAFNFVLANGIRSHMTSS